MDLLIALAVSVVLSTVFIYIGISSFNKDAKANNRQTGKDERGYSVGSVLLGWLIGVIVIFCLIVFTNRARLGSL